MGEVLPVAVLDGPALRVGPRALTIGTAVVVATTGHVLPVSGLPLVLVALPHTCTLHGSEPRHKSCGKIG